MKTTRYFAERVLPRRPEVQQVWCERALITPLRKVVQANGRIRFWIHVPEVRKYLRVVTLADGVTIHNAFFDRNYKESTT